MVNRRRGGSILSPRSFLNTTRAAIAMSMFLEVLREDVLPMGFGGLKKRSFSASSAKRDLLDLALIL